MYIVSRAFKKGRGLIRVYIEIGKRKGKEKSTPKVCGNSIRAHTSELLFPIVFGRLFLYFSFADDNCVLLICLALSTKLTMLDNKLCTLPQVIVWMLLYVQFRCLIKEVLRTLKE